MVKMEKQKKNKLFTFICSLLPGAAEMYMGFMKTGISMMAVFFLSFIIPSVLRISDVFILIGALIWFYSFFHARNLAAYDEEKFQSLPDEFIWESFTNGKKIEISDTALKKWGPGILIVCGVILLWNNLTSIIYRLIPDSMWEYLVPFIDQIPQTVIAVLIIMIGVRMIMGKKEEIDGERK